MEETHQNEKKPDYNDGAIAASIGYLIGNSMKYAGALYGLANILEDKPDLLSVIGGGALFVFGTFLDRASTRAQSIKELSTLEYKLKNKEE